jgi:hypothetical protein
MDAGLMHADRRLETMVSPCASRKKEGRAILKRIIAALLTVAVLLYGAG